MPVSENEIVCYIVGNTITNAKMWGHAPASPLWRKRGGTSFPPVLMPMA